MTDGSGQEPLLPDEAHRFEFYQAVRQLEKRFPGAPRLGTRGPAGKERIRLRPSTGLSFQVSEVSAVNWLDRGPYQEPRAELVTNFLGVVGAGTPLPLTYAQDVLWEEEDNPQMRGFLDLFHHRLLSLLYRAWLHYRYEFAFEEGGLDRLSRALLDLVGLAPEMDPAQLGMTPDRALRYLGLMLMPSRPGAGLETVLSEELETSVRVDPMTPRWLPLPQDQMFRMDPGQRERGFLGQDIIIGTKVLDRAGHITLVIGPVSYGRMLQFRPGQPDYLRTVALTRLFVRQPLDLELKVLVPASELPALSVGGATPAQLGPTCYMGAPKEDPMVITFEASIAKFEPRRRPKKAAAGDRPGPREKAAAGGKTRAA